MGLGHHHLRQIILRGSAERLPPLRRVYARQSNFVLIVIASLFKDTWSSIWRNLIISSTSLAKSISCHNLTSWANNWLTCSSTPFCFRIWHMIIWAWLTSTISQKNWTLVTRLFLTFHPNLSWASSTVYTNSILVWNLIMITFWIDTISSCSIS